MPDYTQDYLANILNVPSTLIARMNELRLYAEGEQPAQVTQTQLELLGKDTEPNFNPVMNVCKIIIASEANRLRVLGQEVANVEDDNIRLLVDEYLDAVWHYSDMDLVSRGLHYLSLRDGDGYLIVSYDPDAGRARYDLNTAYDGVEGVYVAYSDPANRHSALYAFKRWQEYKPRLLKYQSTVERLTIYWPNRIEYYLRVNGQWTPYTDAAAEDMQQPQFYELVNPFDETKTYTAAVAWLTDDGTENGNPLGIPVFHYPHGGLGMTTGVSAIADIVPGVQDAINGAFVDLIAASMLAGFPVNYITGYDGSTKSGDVDNAVKVFPGAMLYQRKPDAAFGQLPSADLSQQIDVLNTHVKNAAILTSTPLPFLTETSQIPAEGTLRAVQEGLVSKVENAQSGLSTIYNKAARYALLLETVYGERLGNDPNQFIDVMIKTRWSDPLPRSQQDILATASQKQALGIPRRQLWAEMGYTDSEIETMLKEADIIRNTVIAATMNALTATGDGAAIQNRATQLANSGDAT